MATTNELLAPLHSKLHFVSPHSQAFLDNLACKEVDLPQLRALSFRGVPDEPAGLRALVWRLLLDFLPRESAAWSDTLVQARVTYDLFKAELVPVYSEEPQEDPDADLWSSIEKDIKRTRQDLNFFFTPTNNTSTRYRRPFIHSTSYVFGEHGQQYFSGAMTDPSVEKHADVVARILFVYAKLNPGVHYVQGMNELLAPIYYLYARDKNEELRSGAEADAFFSFSNLMARMRDTFVDSLDCTETGISGQLNRLGALIARHHGPVSTTLNTLGITPDFFGLRWVLLLLSQDLTLPDVFRLWDSLFTTAEPYTFLLYVCLVLVLQAKSDIMSKDFGQALHSIQHPEIHSVTELIADAEHFYKLDGNC